MPTTYQTHTVRPTTLATMQRCPRKAWFEGVQKIKSESTAAQDVGTHAHKYLALWLSNRVMPPNDDTAGRIARRGLHLLPVVDEAPEVERPFIMRAAPNLSIVSGGIDAFWPQAGILLDHKTCAHTSYIPTSEAIKAGAQAITYAHYLHTRRAQPHWFGTLACKWVYYPKSNERAQVREFTITREEAQDGFERLTSEYLHIVECDDPAQVNGNNAACGDYGGCRFRDVCGAINNKGDYMTLLEKIKAEAAKRNAESQAQQASPVPAILPPDAAPADLSATSEPAKKQRKKSAAVFAGDEPQPVQAPAANSLESTVSVAIPPVIVLYVSCYPTKYTSAVTALDDLLAPLKKNVCDNMGVAHWALVDYAKGSALLAAELAEHLKACSYSAVYADRFSSSFKAVSDVLRESSLTIVEGV